MSRPRILIDGRLLAYRHGGIQRYVRGLASALARLEPDLDIRLVQNRPFGSPLPVVRVLTPPHHRWERRALGLELALRRPAVVHSPDFIPPRLPRHVRSIVTVHDLAFLDYPYLLSAEAERYYGQLAEALTDADRIIAVSRWTAERLQYYFPALAERVRVVHNGVDDCFFASPPADPWQTIAEATGQELSVRLRNRGFLLTVGTVEPRKRYRLLLEAMDRLRERYAESAPMLVVVGQPGWRHDEVISRLQAAVATRQVLWLTDADDRVLRALYATAALLVVPSLDEGFCLPAAEAMVCGLPVLAAERGALPEILGEAGHLIGSDCPDDWAEEIMQLMSNSLRRQMLAERGRSRAQQFCWEETARQTLALYQEVLAR